MGYGCLVNYSIVFLSDFSVVIADLICQKQYFSMHQSHVLCHFYHSLGGVYLSSEVDGEPACG
uniref:Uncharacterized protein n=1 Tax=Arion vulgaris TaxID=1028688 RepID=A0A0B7AKM9_9EUPU